MIKLTPQREIFVQEIIKGKSQRAAYKKAYPRQAKNMPDKHIDRHASVLMKNEKVMSRLAELRARVEKKVEEKLAYGIVEHIKELDELKDMAIAQEKMDREGAFYPAPQLASAVKAVELKGKVTGLYVERREEKNVKNFSDVLNELDELDDE